MDGACIGPQCICAVYVLWLLSSLSPLLGPRAQQLCDSGVARARLGRGSVNRQPLVPREDRLAAVGRGARVSARLEQQPREGRAGGKVQRRKAVPVARARVCACREQSARAV